MDGRGQFGDQFGAFNAFVSMLTVVAVLGSIWLQRIQHREEMRAARDQHEAQMADAERKHAEQMREGARVRELDRLFRLFDRKSQVISELRWSKHGGETLHGRDAVDRAQSTIWKALISPDFMATELAHDLKPFVYKPGAHLKERPVTQIQFQARYETLFSLAKYRIGEYLRTIIAIAKSAARAKRDGDEAFVETALQWITGDEMSMLEYHSLIDVELARALRDLRWTDGEYESMKWTYPQD